MKRNALIRIILWSLVIAILTSLMIGVGFGFSFNRSHRSEDFFSDANSTRHPSVQGHITPPASQIRELDIEWISGDIKICTGNTDRITVEENGATDDKYAMVIRQDEDSLEIRFSREEHNIIGLHNIPEKDLTITVPADWYCEALEIETASASVEIYDLKISNVEFSGASGTCEFDNCDVGLLDIGTASGDVRFVGSLNILDCDAASADVYAVLSNVPSRLELDTMSGDLDVTLPKDAGFTLSMDALSERLDTDFETSSKDGKLLCGDGACRIRIDALSGDVTIRKGA